MTSHLTPDQYRTQAERLIRQADDPDVLLGIGPQRDSERAARRASALVYATLYAGTQAGRPVVPVCPHGHGPVTVDPEGYLACGPCGEYVRATGSEQS